MYSIFKVWDITELSILITFWCTGFWYSAYSHYCSAMWGLMWGPLTVSTYWAFPWSYLRMLTATTLFCPMSACGFSHWLVSLSTVSEHHMKVPLCAPAFLSLVLNGLAKSASDWTAQHICHNHLDTYTHVCKFRCEAYFWAEACGVIVLCYCYDFWFHFWCFVHLYLFSVCPEELTP